MSLGLIRMIEALASRHDLSSFDCGEEDRNDWLRHRGLKSNEADYSRTYVALNEAGKVIGFYTLAASSMARETLPRGIRHGAPQPVPIVLLGQIAIDRMAQGQRLADTLLMSAFEHVLRAAEIIGCAMLGVQPAQDWLTAYYQSKGFNHRTGTSPAIMLITVERIRLLFPNG